MSEPGQAEQGTRATKLQKNISCCRGGIRTASLLLTCGIAEHELSSEASGGAAVYIRLTANLQPVVSRLQNPRTNVRAWISHIMFYAAHSSLVGPSFATTKLQKWPSRRRHGRAFTVSPKKVQTLNRVEPRIGQSATTRRSWFTCLFHA